MTMFLALMVGLFAGNTAFEIYLIRKERSVAGLAGFRQECRAKRMETHVQADRE